MTEEVPNTFRKWLRSALESEEFILQPLVPEASTRRFFRVVDMLQKSHMAMISPPETEDNDQFVVMSEVFLSHNVPVPSVHAFDRNRGFLLVDDFGPIEFLHIYPDRERRQQALALAVNHLIDIQKTTDSRIPVYSLQRLRDELGIFSEWCCEKLLEISAEPLNEVQSDLIKTIDSQPKVTVHRDYHCRNLLLRGSEIGIVDFQDALIGPCMYDLASLLYDCYFSLEESEVEAWFNRFRELARESNIPSIESRSDMIRGLECCALQRQLKAMGIFCRLWFLQQKKSHLPFVVPVLDNVSVLAKRSGFGELSAWLSEHVRPKLEKAIQGLLA